MTHHARVRAARVAMLLLAPLAVSAQSGEPVRRELAPGVTYTRTRDPRGPWNIHVVRIDLRRAPVELRAVRADAQLRGRERTSSMVQRTASPSQPVLAAINADFFDLRSGENENNQILAGEWWKGLKVTESPYDTYDNVHAQFAMDSALHPQIERYILDARAWVRDSMLPIIAVNASLRGEQEGSALYTPRYGSATPRDSTRKLIEAPISAIGHRGDTLLYVRRGAVLTGAGGSSIPPDGAVLAAFGARAKAVEAMREGDTVRVLLTVSPRLPGGRAPALLIGGWPRILRDGVNVAGDAATIEGTISRNAEARHPRSAVAYSKNGRVLWLIAVDGRSTASVGMTLVELAGYLRTLGAWNALNFDGGGSTTMVIDGAVVNTPSDDTGERAVGNALLVLRRAPRR